MELALPVWLKCKGFRQIMAVCGSGLAAISQGFGWQVRRVVLGNMRVNVDEQAGR